MRLGLIGGSAFPRDWREWPGFIPAPQMALPRHAGAAAELVGLNYHATDHEVVFLARHGSEHHLLPHEIDYRANLSLLAAAAVDVIIATHTVGGIDTAIPVGGLVLPDQIIDYTYGRANTFGGNGDIRHVRFDAPFTPALAHRLEQAAQAAGVDIHRGGVYGATQGPRFESPAEIERMARDGCTLVGMTAMPEAALARELDLPYASLSLVVNAAAGRGEFDMASIQAAGARGMAAMQRVLTAFLELPELSLE